MTLSPNLRAIQAEAAPRATHQDAGGSDEAMARVSRAREFVEAAAKSGGVA